jgi:hypothetical protein
MTEMVTRIKVALPTTYPYQAGFAMLAGQIATSRPRSIRAVALCGRDDADLHPIAERFFGVEVVVDGDGKAARR